MKLSLAIFMLTYLPVATMAQNNAIQQPVQQLIQRPTMIQQYDPTAIQRMNAIDDAAYEHAQQQIDKAVVRSNARLNCELNSWHPENC